MKKISTFNYKEVLERFSKINVVVLGDLVLDYFLYGTTDRISREAPVLIVRQERLEARPGGAANVLANVVAMGAKARAVGLCGSDAAGKDLLAIMKTRGIDTQGVVVDSFRPTTTKTRVLAGGINTVRQQMLRIDRLGPKETPPAIQEKLISRLKKALKGAQALLVSDYGEGVLGGMVKQFVIELCRRGFPVFADARRGIESYPRAWALTPNEPELSAAYGKELENVSILEKAGRWLLRKTKAEMVLLKRGRQGMALFQPGKKTAFCPAFGPVEVADVTGAGDTVLATFSLARIAGADGIKAMYLANTAGGIKVTKAGTATVSAAELSLALGG